MGRDGWPLSARMEVDGDCFCPFGMGMETQSEMCCHGKKKNKKTANSNHAFHINLCFRFCRCYMYYSNAFMTKTGTGGRRRMMMVFIAFNKVNR